MTPPVETVNWQSKITPQILEKIPTLGTAPYCRTCELQVGDLVQFSREREAENEVSYGFVVDAGNGASILVYWFNGRGNHLCTQRYPRDSMLLMGRAYPTLDDVLSEYDIS